MEIQLSKSQVAVIDDVDSDLALYKWSATYNKKYASAVKYRAVRVVNKHSIYLHTVILERVIGRKLLSGELVDHKDRNPLNNRRENLRLANHRLNAVNSSLHNTNTTGFRGVSKHRNKFQASIGVKNTDRYLGMFDTAEEAATAYDKAAKELYGQYAYQNLTP